MLYETKNERLELGRWKRRNVVVKIEGDKELVNYVAGIILQRSRMKTGINVNKT